jgi:hypothetical protein
MAGNPELKRSVSGLRVIQEFLRSIHTSRLPGIDPANFLEATGWSFVQIGTEGTWEPVSGQVAVGRRYGEIERLGQRGIAAGM